MRKLAVLMLLIIMIVAAAGCGGRSIEQVGGLKGTDDNEETPGPTKDKDPIVPINSRQTEKEEICASGYDVEYAGTMVEAISNGVAVALAPQGIYVLSQEPTKATATLHLYSGDGELIETTVLNTACGGLLDLEWQDGELYFLGIECDWNMDRTALLLRLEDGHLVHGPTLGDDVVAIASGEEGELFVLKHDSIGRLSLEERHGFIEPTVDAELPSPPGWGPTSGFAYVDGHFMFSRDAFEAGMTNQILIVSDKRNCSADVEIFLPGVPGIKIAADSERLLLLGSDLESFTWSTR